MNMCDGFYHTDKKKITLKHQQQFKKEKKNKVNQVTLVSELH